MANEKKIITLEHISAIAAKVKAWAANTFAPISHTHNVSDVTGLETSLTDLDEVLPFGGFVNVQSVKSGSTQVYEFIRFNNATGEFVVSVKKSPFSQEYDYYNNWGTNNEGSNLYNNHDTSKIYVCNGKTYVWKVTTVDDETTYTLVQTGNDRINGLVGSCPTASDDTIKVISLPDCDLSAPVEGMEIIVFFSNTNTKENPTFDVNGWGGTNGTPVYYNNNVIANSNKEYAGYAGRYCRYMYLPNSSSQSAGWWFLGWSVERDTTYTTMTYNGTNGHLDTGTSTTGMVISPKTLKSFVEDKVNEKVSTVYRPMGSCSSSYLKNLPLTTKTGNEWAIPNGSVYNITDELTTDDNFVEGAEKTYPAGTNVVLVEPSAGVRKWDVLAGIDDMSAYQTKATLKKDLLDTMSKKSVVEDVHYVASGSGDDAYETCYEDKQVVTSSGEVGSAAVAIHCTASINEVKNAMDAGLA